MKNPDKEISRLKKEIEKTKKIKIKGTNITTIKELRQKEKESREEEIIFGIQAFMLSKKNGRGNASAFAGAVNLSRQTFSKYVNHFEKYNTLPENKNIGSVPWNKTSESTILKVVTVTKDIVDRVNKFAKEPVPTLMPLLFEKAQKELKRKYPNINISLSTYKRILDDSNFAPILKFETKMGKKIRRRLAHLNEKLKELKLLKNHVNVELEEKATTKKILSGKTMDVAKISYSISKRRSAAKPGMIIQWDGSLDQFKNKTRVTRMQAIDHNTLSTMGLGFVLNENNNGFQMLISQIIDNHGVPSMILGDKRKGVDPADKGALHSIVCKLLGISLNLDSNSIHKAELEALNGKMHPFITYYCALNNISTITSLNKQSKEIIAESNKYFKRENPDYSHLRQASEEVKEILRGKITQIYISSSDGIIYKKLAYQAILGDKPVSLERNTWAIVSLVNGIPTKIWTDQGIFPLRRIRDELRYKVSLEDIKLNMVEKHFIDNGVMILNRETYDFLFKQILSLGEKNAIKNRSWRLDQQILEKIKRKKEL